MAGAKTGTRLTSFAFNVGRERGFYSGAAASCFVAAAFCVQVVVAVMKEDDRQIPMHQWPGSACLLQKKYHATANTDVAGD